MNVQVMSRKKFEEYVFQQHRESSIVVSISSCGDSPPFVVCNNANKIVNVFNAFFNDTDDRNTVYGGIDFNTAIQIAQFVKINYTAHINKIIVHCDAGQSRSAGVAAAILKYFTNDDTQIFDNPRYTPNRLCYRLVLQALMEY